MSSPDHEPTEAEFIEALHAQLPPPDTVARQGLTRETLLRLNDLAGTGASVTIPGDVRHDVDGLPNDVGEPTTEDALMTPAAVSAAEVERAGLTPDDVPNLHVIDTEKGKTTDD